MRCLTVRQPWAWAIAHGGKDVENRTWSTKYRGLLTIHAGQSWDPRGADDEQVNRVWNRVGSPLPPLGLDVVDVGAVVAVVDLVDVHDSRLGDCSPRACTSPWAQHKQVHWVLASPRPLADPVPCRGRLGLWTLPADVLAAVEAQVTA